MAKKKTKEQILLALLQALKAAEAELEPETRGDFIAKDKTQDLIKHIKDIYWIE